MWHEHFMYCFLFLSYSIFLYCMHCVHFTYLPVFIFLCLFSILLYFIFLYCMQCVHFMYSFQFLLFFVFIVFYFLYCVQCAHFMFTVFFPQFLILFYACMAYEGFCLCREYENSHFMFVFL